MSNSYYESNRPYNPQQSNRPIYNVISQDEIDRLKRPSKTEGAMWGAAQAAVTPALYSAALYGVKKGSREAVSGFSEGLGDKFGKAQDFVNKFSGAKKTVISGANKTIDKHVASESGKSFAKSAGNLAFGTGAKAVLGRIAIGASIGATQGALHNASNGIVGPY